MHGAGNVDIISTIVSSLPKTKTEKYQANVERRNKMTKFTYSRKQNGKGALIKYKQFQRLGL